MADVDTISPHVFRFKAALATCRDGGLKRKVNGINLQIGHRYKHDERHRQTSVSAIGLIKEGNGHGLQITDNIRRFLKRRGKAWPP